jgi:hypothetical protein
MKQIRKFLAAGLLLCSASAMADTGQTLTINGETVQKAVVSMTFDGDNVVLHFDDQTTRTADMAQVVLLNPVTTDIYSVKGVVSDKLDIQGLAPGTEVIICDASGRMVMKAKADEAHTMLSAKSLKSGIYVMKTGKRVVKFMKK